jgi:hypothetical protein
VTVTARFGLAGVAVGRRSAPLWFDGVVGLLIFLCAGIGGTLYWNRTNTVPLPFFYQSYFEPSVMIACGKGFVVAQPPVPAVATFLAQKVDRLSCDQIPPGTVVGTEGLYQGAWRYLMYAVGLAWRVLGISWSGLGPLFGTLFAVTAVALYGIFRLGMSPPLALLGVVLLSISRLHLTYLPILRDYAKGPITLVLIFLLGLLVARRAAWKGVLAIAAAYGVVLGIGYGFRTDFLVNIPAFFLTLALFLEGGVFRNIALKAVAGAVCIAAFLVAGWPIISSVVRSGGCQWHTALLGFSWDFSRELGLEEPSYEFNRRYSDNFTYATVTSYTARARPGVGHIEYCQPEYDAATGRFLVELVKRFPADMIVRAYASVLRIVELPLAWKPVPPRDIDASPYDAPGPEPSRGIGLAVVVLAIGLASVASLRLGLFLLFFLLYFGGYPTIQFDARHYFHLEFITWWAAGFVLQSAISDAWPLVRTRHWTPALTTSIRRAALMLTGCAVALVVTLWAARVYQQRAARSLLQGYVAADRDEIPIDRSLPATLQTIARTHQGTDPETADFLEVDVNQWRCGASPAVTFQYDKATRHDFSRTFVLHGSTAFHEPTHVFMPVYDGFQGIALSDTQPGCVGGVYRVRDPGQFSFLLEAVLPAHWETSPLYQRFDATARRSPDVIP